MCTVCPIPIVAAEGVILCGNARIGVNIGHIGHFLSEINVPAEFLQ